MFFNLFGSMLLLLAEKRTERSNVSGLMLNSGRLIGSISSFGIFEN